MGKLLSACLKNPKSRELKGIGETRVLFKSRNWSNLSQWTSLLSGLGQRNPWWPFSLATTSPDLLVCPHRCPLSVPNHTAKTEPMLSSNPTPPLAFPGFVKGKVPLSIQALHPTHRQDPLVLALKLGGSVYSLQPVTHHLAPGLLQPSSKQTTSL